MTEKITRTGKIEALLADLLNYGTLLASGVISFGLVQSETRVTKIGIAIFILLPIVRVIVMLVVFVKARDWRISGIAALVLIIILLSLLYGALSITPTLA